MDNRIALTVWKDGTHTVWGGMDAFYAQGDPDHLFSIGIGDLLEEAQKEAAQSDSAKETP